MLRQVYSNIYDTIRSKNIHTSATCCRVTGCSLCSACCALNFGRLTGERQVGVPAASNADGDGATAVAMVVQLRFNISAIPAVDRQPWPGVLKLWVGDGGGYGGAPAPQRRLATAAESASLQLTF